MIITALVLFLMVGLVVYGAFLARREAEIERESQEIRGDFDPDYDSLLEWHEENNKSNFP